VPKRKRLKTAEASGGTKNFLYLRRIRGATWAGRIANVNEAGETVTEAGTYHQAKKNRTGQES